MLLARRPSLLVIDYRKIIHDIAGLLRPGGMAIFYEPVLQGKILVAFMADLMRRIENNTKWGVLDDSGTKAAYELKCGKTATSKMKTKREPTSGRYAKRMM